MRRLLRPIIRQFMAAGITYAAFDRLVREVFVEVAEKEFAVPFKRQTDSRISLVTGINRKEVAALRQNLDARRSAVEVEDSLVTHVIGRWMAGSPYATPDGVARRLPYEADAPRAPSFARLAREVVGADIPVRSVLDELLRLGVAELSADGEVALKQEAHLPAADTEGKLSLLGSDPAELFKTIAHNIDHADSPWLQRKVVYDNIGSEALTQLKSEARRVGEEFIRRANALLASYDRDRNRDAPGGDRARVVLGAYYFEETAERPDDAQSSQHKKQSRPPGRIRRPR